MAGPQERLGAGLGFVSGMLLNISLTDTLTTFVMGGVGALGGYFALQALKFTVEKTRPKLKKLIEKLKSKKKDENNQPR